MSKKQVRYIAGSVGLVPAALGVTLPVAASAAAASRAPGTGKAVYYKVPATPGCATTAEKHLTPKPSHNMVSGHVWYAAAFTYICFGTLVAKIDWDKSFSKWAQASARWSNAFGELLLWGPNRHTVYHKPGSWPVSWGIHSGTSGANSATVCVTSQYAGGNQMCGTVI